VTDFFFGRRLAESFHTRKVPGRASSSINTGGTFSSGNEDSTKGWGPSNHAPGFKIEDQILEFLTSHGLVWDPQPDLENAVASFKEAEYQSHVHDFLHKSIWNNDLEGSLRQLFKQLNVDPENRNAAIKCIKQNGLAERCLIARS
jgi:hypothetical protein